MSARRQRQARIRPQPDPLPARPPERNRFLILAAVLVAAGALAYSTSFRGVFVLDDLRAIVQNTTITSLATAALDPPPACTVSGRPVANLSLAVNYALAPARVRDVFAAGGDGPRSGSREDFLRNAWGYHFVNLAIHLAAGLLLFGCVRRTLASARLAPVFGSAAIWVAFVTALVWVVHPLHTESVTYVVQRVESLMGLFYLATLYCAIRAVDTRHRRAWEAGAMVACALGMGTKEAMVTAPLVVALWDWTFVPPDRPARWRLWTSLAATWIALALLVWNEHRAPSIDLAHATAARYLFTQAAVILHYVRLSLVPSPLVFLYSWPLAPSLTAVAPQVAIVVFLVLLTAVGVARRSPWAFAGAWFFLILAPTSSVLPIVTEVAAEHRMYLPLAAVIACVAASAFVVGERVLARVVPGDARKRSTVRLAAAAVATLLVVVTFTIQTYARNRDYWSDTDLWADVVTKQPDNQRARVLYGVALMNANRLADAERQLQEAVRLQQSDPVALGRLGLVQASQGNLDAAIASWEKAVSLAPDSVVDHRYLGEAYGRKHDDAQAVSHLEVVLAQFPDDVVVLTQVATLRADSNDMSVRNPLRAVELADRAANLTGRGNAQVLNVLAVAQANAGRYRDAAATASEALRLARMNGNTALASELELRVSAYQSRAQ